MSKIAVLGAGAWGTTLAVLLSENKHDVTLWSYEKDLAAHMQEFHENDKYLPGFPLIPSINTTSDLKTAAAGKETLLLAIPTQFLKSVLDQLRDNAAQLIISAVKGIEERTLKRPSEIIAGRLKGKIAVLSGPNLAKEIAKGLPAATVAASRDQAAAQKTQELLNSNRFRVYTNDDPVGVELSGALKNVIAIAAGVADGFGLGDNAVASLLVRGMAEIKRLGCALGAKEATFFGLAGIGDLIATCGSELSRNHFVGVNLAKGKKLEEILKSMKDVAEGVPTCRAARELAKKKKVEMPITEEVHQVLFEGKDPYQALLSLMQRTPTSE